MIGHFYGATVSATYSAHPGEHVAKLIVISPGALVGGLAGGDNLQSRLSGRQRVAIYARLLQPRSLLVHILLQVNPRAVHSFAGDAEMDARNDDIYATTEPALHGGPRSSTHGVPPEDVRPLLGGYTIPTLVIKGSCDYLSWASGLDYVHAFGKGPVQLVYLSGAGHNVFEDKPSEAQTNIQSFLRGEPLPDAYAGQAVPADFEMGY